MLCIFNLTCMNPNKCCSFKSPKCFACVADVSDGTYATGDAALNIQFKKDFDLRAMLQPKKSSFWQIN